MLTGEEAFLEAQKLDMPDVGVLHRESNTVQLKMTQPQGFYNFVCVCVCKRTCHQSVCHKHTSVVTSSLEVIKKSSRGTKKF